jgi:hypothetical protein
MKAVFQVMKEVDEANKASGQLPTTTGLIVQVCKAYAKQAFQWQDIDQLDEIHHGQDLLLITHDNLSVRPDGSALNLGKYRHDGKYVTVGHVNYPLTRFKQFMLTNLLLP